MVGARAVVKKAKKQNWSGSRETGNEFSGRDGVDSDVEKAGDTSNSTGSSTVVGSVLKPQSADTHPGHRAMPSPGPAQREKGE